MSRWQQRKENLDYDVETDHENFEVLKTRGEFYGSGVERMVHRDDRAFLVQEAVVMARCGLSLDYIPKLKVSHHWETEKKLIERFYFLDMSVVDGKVGCVSKDGVEVGR